jgi:redox-sensitive bicupin YhaK (pirin superfamily)
MKKIFNVYDSPPAHWVGDGFPVRSVLSHHAMEGRTSPFLLLDYAGPAEFEPARGKPGVGAHPHKGFETVTIVYKGELEHGDSGGNHGSIGPGDVQWMTAASGVVHEEFHSKHFSENGGTLEMVQLWVNLPAKFKTEPAGYQTLLNANIPVVALPDDAGSVRVIAGEFQNTKGPAHTFTPVNAWDVSLKVGRQAEFAIPDGYTTALLVRNGTVAVDGQTAGHGQLILFEREGENINVQASADAEFLLLSGEPINEPVAWQGPFVMNTQEELRQAIIDFQSGRMGRL